MHLSEGTFIQNGKYQIVSLISEGDFCCVYAACNMSFISKAKKVVIKELFVKDYCCRHVDRVRVGVANKSKEKTFERVRNRFIAEAETLYELRHSNVVRVTDLFEENGTSYYVMDYIDGNSLDELLEQRGCLDTEEALGYIRQVAFALKSVHDYGCLHLDINPKNIIIDDSGRAILVGFSAFRQEVCDECDGVPHVGLHVNDFTSLEQCVMCVDGFSPATDIYSLGAVLYYAVSGNIPVASNKRAGGEELSPLSERVDENLRETIERMMVLSYKERIQNVEEILSLIGVRASAEDDDSVTVLEPVKNEQRVAQNKNRKPLIILLFLISLAGIILFLLFAKKTPAEMYEKGKSEYESGNYTDAFEWYRKSAEQGFVDAQLALGLCYSDGLGTEQSDEKAVFWYRKSADAGNAVGQCAVGKCYMNGKGVNRSPIDAVDWFRKSAEQGCPEAQYYMGYCYFYAKGVKKSCLEAVRWWRIAAGQGQPDALFEMGNCYDDGVVVSESEEEAYRCWLESANAGCAKAQFAIGLCEESDENAARWILKAAEQGLAEAQHRYAVCCLWGLGVEISEDEAVKWYRMAAEQGYAESQLSLGCCYELGVGSLEISHKDALEWFHKAADQDNTEAMLRIAYFYRNGMGVSPSEEKTVEWYRKAAELYNSEAGVKLGNCYLDGFGVPQSDTIAVKWYKKFVTWNSDAQVALGFCYEKGQGIEKSYVEAEKLYRKAADSGNAIAQNRLAMLYMHDNGVGPDYDKAYELFVKSAEKGEGAAMYNLGTFYENGYGRDASIDDAIYWYRKAVDCGYADAKKDLERLGN